MIYAIHSFLDTHTQLHVKVCQSNVIVLQLHRGIGYGNVDSAYCTNICVCVSHNFELCVKAVILVEFGGNMTTILL